MLVKIIEFLKAGFRKLIDLDQTVFLNTKDGRTFEWMTQPAYKTIARARIINQVPVAIELAKEWEQERTILCVEAGWNYTSPNLQVVPEVPRDSLW